MLQIAPALIMRFRVNEGLMGNLNLRRHANEVLKVRIFRFSAEFNDVKACGAHRRAYISYFAV